MAKFECNWCGKCCRSFGEFIKIERQLTERDYYCRYTITNELFLVHVQPQYAEEIADILETSDTDGSPEPGSDNHKACIFMLKNPDGKGFACAIYPTCPAICREFKCYRLLVHHHSSGELRGRVMGINELKTTDEILAQIWSDVILHIPHPFSMLEQALVHQPHNSAAQISHGHDSLIHAHIRGMKHADDHEWVNNVITLLASHGYKVELVD